MSSHIHNSTLSYFPGCSLVTTAKENNDSLMDFFTRMDIELEELPDWNCCGSSSIHCIDSHQALMLAARNLALAPAGRPLVVACPNCLIRLKSAQLSIAHNPDLQAQYASLLGRVYDPELEIVHVFDLMDRLSGRRLAERITRRLDTLRFVPYYGCMLSRPPALRHERHHNGIMEKVLGQTGARDVQWAFARRCCGTFLSVTRPELVTTMINEIMQGAKAAGADCIVTACAMCHLNLELRCTLTSPIPVLHFSELMALAVGNRNIHQWISRHLIDPMPLLVKIQAFRFTWLPTWIV